MRLSLGGVDVVGEAVDLRDAPVDATEVAAAVRDPGDGRVACAPPGRVHERVGVVHRGVSVRVLAAVAAAARSRGASTEYDGELASVATDLTALDVPDVDLESAREDVAAAATDVDALEEQVARASGRVEARRKTGEGVAEPRAALEAATRELAAAETEYHAAREQLRAAREQARGARNARERRLELEDRQENLRRAARRELAARFAGSFRRAVRALPVPGDPASPGEFDGPDWAAACAVARLAGPGAPLVVGSDVFGDPHRARAALDAPVLLVEV